MNAIDRLAQRVAALEKRVDFGGIVDNADRKEASERDFLASEIEALEGRLAAAINEEDVEEKGSSDEEKEVKAEDDKKDDEKKASIVDPNGVEEDISQDYLHEVEDLEHGTELATGDSALDVAPTEFVARMKNASARLDAVADYLEKTGRTAMALRIDKIADAIDSRIASFTK